MPLPDFNESIITASSDELVRPVRTMPLFEFKFRDYCNENGIACYLPLKKAWKIHNVNSNGKTYNYSKEVLRPMFTSYVFVKTPKDELRALFDSKQILQILPVADQQAFINEIKTVRTIECVGFEQKLEFHTDIAEGDHFIIQSGIWEGVTGWLSKRDSAFRWTVQLEFLQQQITTDIDPSLYKMTRVED